MVFSARTGKLKSSFRTIHQKADTYFAAIAAKSSKAVLKADL